VAFHGVIARYGQVDKAILYGSRAKGNCKADSDIDLTLVGGHDLNLHVLYRIMDDIDVLRAYSAGGVLWLSTIEHLRRRFSHRVHRRLRFSEILRAYYGT